MVDCDGWGEEVWNIDAFPRRQKGLGKESSDRVMTEGGVNKLVRMRRMRSRRLSRWTWWKVAVEIMSRLGRRSRHYIKPFPPSLPRSPQKFMVNGFGKGLEGGGLTGRPQAKRQIKLTLIFLDSNCLSRTNPPHHIPASTTSSIRDTGASSLVFGLVRILKSSLIKC